jgi:hypothetical protein
MVWLVRNPKFYMLKTECYIFNVTYSMLHIQCYIFNGTYSMLHIHYPMLDNECYKYINNHLVI